MSQFIFSGLLYRFCRWYITRLDKHRFHDRLVNVEPSSTSTGFNLQKVCDGTNSPIGEMTIVNQEKWVGNYFYGISGDEYMINLDFITLRNTNNFDLHIRYGFTGANGYQVVTTEPIIVPALSDWAVYEN
jgi:hypothetical protein